MAKSPYARFGRPATATETQTVVRHIVTGGETLPSITATEYQTGYDSELWRQLGEANGVDDIEALTVGVALDVPTPKPSDQ